jgi:hypothetical protein
MTRQALQLKGVNPKTPFALNMCQVMGHMMSGIGIYLHTKCHHGLLELVGQQHKES